MKKLEVYSNTPWGQITNVNHEKNLRIIWRTYGELLRHIKHQGYPHPVIESERRACKKILTSSNPQHNAFQFLKMKYLASRLNKTLMAMDIIDSLIEIKEWIE